MCLPTPGLRLLLGEQLHAAHDDEGPVRQLCGAEDDRRGRARAAQDPHAQGKKESCGKKQSFILLSPCRALSVFYQQGNQTVRQTKPNSLLSTR